MGSPYSRWSYFSSYDFYMVSPAELWPSALGFTIDISWAPYEEYRSKYPEERILYNNSLILGIRDVHPVAAVDLQLPTSR
ncbi:hypothetical protein XELAEV_18032882mg [Xenopus laevis]|uniref:Uncharacterized protein n=1 Tax=Xenopus laevis TaxID=8355 RepID=A0A974CI90_XENLA|nr:hypothetical protein XELAEV_18032882mg [Xenopus laevis]